MMPRAHIDYTPRKTDPGDGKYLPTTVPCINYHDVML